MVEKHTHSGLQDDGPRLKIPDSIIGADINLTITNLNTLVGGASSNADSLHTHDLSTDPPVAWTYGISGDPTLSLIHSNSNRALVLEQTGAGANQRAPLKLVSKSTRPSTGSATLGDIIIYDDGTNSTLEFFGRKSGTFAWQVAG